MLVADQDDRQAIAGSKVVGDETVFVLDGDPGFRRVLAGHLLRAGFRATLFRSAGALLTALRILRPSIIVADIVGREMSGADLLGAIRRDDDVRNIPLVIMTDENDTALPLRVDASVVYKPEVDGLIATMRSVLRAG
jgi:DNA-binding response OmpR family regulator